MRSWVSDIIARFIYVDGVMLHSADIASILIYYIISEVDIAH